MSEALQSPEDYQQFYEDMARRHQMLGDHVSRITIHYPELRGLERAPSLNLVLFTAIMARRGVDHALARLANIPNDPEASLEEANQGFIRSFDTLLGLQEELTQCTTMSLAHEPQIRQSAVFSAKVERGDMQVRMKKTSYFSRPKDAVREIAFTLPRHIPWVVAMRANESATYGELDVGFASLPEEDVDSQFFFSQYLAASAPRIAAMSLILDRMAVGQEAEALRDDIDQQGKIA